MDHKTRIEIIEKRLKKRYLKETLFRSAGITAIAIALSVLVILFYTIISSGYTAFQQTFIQLSIHIDESSLDPEGARNTETLSQANYAGLIKKSIKKAFPDVKKRRLKRKLYGLISAGASFQIRDMVMKNNTLLGQTISIWVPASDDVDLLMKGHTTINKSGSSQRLTKEQIQWIGQLRKNHAIQLQFNTLFFTQGDSREPELAGILGAATGSIYTMLVTLLLSFPVGVAAAVYLEELAPKNRWIDIIEVNINNLAAVPSIVFGLLGLAIFINFFGVPRSAPLAGGLVLALMTLPTIIIASRASLQSVPPSIRDAALSIGASELQAIFHHVLPSALPGILTGAIIGLARALGETAPLLMIGMVAFIVDIPEGILDKATVLPVQIYLWADSPERAFMEKTSAAIMVLLAFLIVMNSFAVLLRKRFEKRW